MPAVRGIGEAESHDRPALGKDRRIHLGWPLTDDHCANAILPPLLHDPLDGPARTRRSIGKVGVGLLEHKEEWRSRPPSDRRLDQKRDS